ncbi:TPA: YadA-like family protein, partial [Neisseria gonorrhoeae]
VCYLHISRATYLLIWYRPKKYAVALGSSSTASGEYSYASGYNSVASGNKSYAAGYASVASAEGSVVIGDSRQVKPEADQGVAVGSKATVKNKAKQRVVVGSEAKVNAERGIAIGKEAKAGGKTTNTLLDGPAYYADAIAVGYQAEAGKGGAIALGKQAKATKQNGMALGVESEAAGDFSTAVGNESKAKGQGGVGLGNQSKAEADFAVAVGNKAEATKENSLVIGRYARANGNHSVSLGSRSEIKDGVSNSVAPGYGSVASENNVVSVAYKETPQSTELSYRKIVGVDDGVNDFDAVNVRQLKAMQGQNMAELFSVRSEVRGVAASSAALSALTPLSYDANNPTQFMVGFGTYKGRQAMALGLSHFVNDRFMVKVGGTLGGNKTGHMMNVGLTWKFGTSQGVPATSDKVLMEQLMQDNRQLKPRLEKLEARLNAM